MKTIRILLLPNESQILLMENMIKVYSAWLIRSVIEERWEMSAEETPDLLCASTKVQLCRDIRRRMRRFPKRFKLSQMYCRWGNDYQLIDNKVYLPLGASSINTLSIDCIYRPFQTKLLGSKHPEILTLKRIKDHWYAYLLVEEDK